MIIGGKKISAPKQFELRINILYTDCVYTFIFEQAFFDVYTYTII